MKIILIQDVSGIGRKYEVKNVADGYAINFLFPRKLAVLATDKELKKIEIEKIRNEAEKGIQNELLEKNLKDLDGKIITIQGKASKTGHLFAGIHKEEIAKLANIPANLINLEHSIKEIGTHKIKAGKVEFEIVVKKE